MTELEKNFKNQEKNEYLSKIIGRIIAGCVFNALIFQFILWRFIHRDIPWYMDMWAGIFFANKYFAWLLSALWIGTLVASYCGIDYPFFVLPLEK